MRPGVRGASAWPPATILESQVRENNYLPPCRIEAAHCALGPELAAIPISVRTGRAAIERAGASLGARLRQASAKCVTVSRTSRPSFQVRRASRPGDVHGHYYGAHSLSFADEMLLAEGDVMAIQFGGFGRALRNPVKIESPMREPVVVRSDGRDAMKICRFLAGDSAIRLGLVVDEDAHVVV